MQLDFTSIMSNAVLSTIVMFVLGFVLLFLLYYFTSPFYTQYADKRSRLIYSGVNAVYFALVLALFFAILPGLSVQYGTIPSLVVGIVIAFLATGIQVYVISTLVKRGYIKMRRKTSAGTQAVVKGKRK